MPWRVEKAWAGRVRSGSRCSSLRSSGLWRLSPYGPKGWVPPPVPPDGKWVVEATFEEPETYVLRCLASDGALGTDEDVTVTVSP